ncbi:hypothetical protein [Romboutsia sp.]|uniref:hypothetical protein n=1 Tax=Romboutsia sp. TaxID=1965302 RepID=UPI003F2B6BC0
MRWINVTSVEELKTLGKFRDITWEIKQDLDEMANISGRNWKVLYDKIVKFREFTRLVTVQQQDTDSYFTSKANEYIFYLTELDGEIRMKKLGITKSHFTNKKKSKKWRDKISKQIQ